MIWRISS
ncbi:hypothetical protein KSF78_0006165 [Schistosoma japonicum]|nr:hypothetical protein KSF78_0006165 [Schistosoma japonicum]